MSDTDDLVTWLTAVLDEDERVARRAEIASVGGSWFEHDRLHVGVRRDDGTVGHLTNPDMIGTAAHIAAHDPAAVLADIAAKRRVLRMWSRYQAKADAHRSALAELETDIEAENRTGVWSGPGLPDVRQRGLRREEDMLGSERNALFLVIRTLASVYAARPGYRQEWGP